MLLLPICFTPDATTIADSATPDATTIADSAPHAGLILMLPNGTVSNTPANAICAEEC
jgi:hypothetical protein